MKRILNILNKPYPYYIPFSRSIRLLIFFSVIVPIFLIAFKPFGLNNSDCEWLTPVLAGISLPIFITLAINFYGVANLLPGFFNDHSWSIWKEAVWSLWNFFTIMGTTSIYWSVIPVCTSTPIHWTEHLFRAFLIGLLPGFSCIYFNYSRALKRKLKQASELNSELLAKISYYEHGSLSLVGENNSEVINLSTDNLLFIQSYDNYAKVAFEKLEKTSNELIRASLKYIESQINYPFIVRCHRSFIINLAKVEEVSGNARDFKVKLRNHEEWLPVSREAYKKIASLINDLGAGSQVMKLGKDF